MIKRLKNFLKHPTSVDVIINTVGNYMNVFFTALFALILVRILSPAQYGVLSVLLGIAYVLANVLDFGTTATIYSFLPIYLENNKQKALHFIKSTFSYQSFFSVIVLAVLFITFPYLDKVFFKTGAPLWELYFTCFAVLFFIWQNFILNALYASRRFLQANIYLNLASVAKTIIILILVALHMISVGAVILVFGIVGPTIFFLLLFFEKKQVFFNLLKADIRREEFRFSYTLTYFLASQFFNLGMRMDLFLLSYFRPKPEVGYYGLSQKIILTITTTISSITQVLSPRFSRIKTSEETVRQIKTAFYYMLIPVGFFTVLFMMPHQVYTILFTKRFVYTADITRALSVSYVWYALGTIPMLFILYTVKKPGYVLLSNIVFFLILSIGSWILIPVKGVFGPPYAIFSAFMAAIIIQFAALVIEFRKKFPKYKV